MAATQAASGELRIQVPDTLKVSAGETALAPIMIAVPQGFTASVYLTTSAPTLMTEQVIITPGSTANPPYAEAKFSIKTIAGYTKGTHRIIIEGKNGDLIAKDTCYLTVIESTRWKIFPTFGARYFVQDRAGDYWYSLWSPGYEVPHQYQLSSDLLDTTSHQNRHATGAVIDKNGDKWFYNWKGVLRFDGTYWSQYGFENFSLKPVGLAIDSNNMVWVATRGGLAKLVNYKWEFVDIGTGTTSNFLTSVSVDGQGNIWVGSVLTGLHRFNGTSWQNFTTDNSEIPSKSVWNVTAESDGTVWFTTPKPKFYEEAANPMTDQLFFTDGLTKFNNNTFTRYTNENSSLPTNDIGWIAIDKKGNKWIAASPWIPYNDLVKPGGLIKFDNTTFTVFDTTNSPVPSNMVTWVGVDNENNIWFRSHGLGVFNENGLSPRIATSIETPLQAPDLSAELAIAPNPAEESAVIRYFANRSGLVAIYLSNVLGEKIFTIIERNAHEAGDFSQKIDVSKLPTGVYFCTFKNEGQVRTTTINVVR